MGAISFTEEFIPTRVGSEVPFNKQTFKVKKKSAFVVFGFLHHPGKECKEVVGDISDHSFYAMPIPTMKIELNSRDCQIFVLDIFEQFQTWAENAFTSQLPPSEMELCQQKSAKEFSLGNNHNLRESYRRQSALAARK